MFSFGKKNAAPPPAKASRPAAPSKSKNLAQVIQFPFFKSGSCVKVKFVSTAWSPWYEYGR